MKTNMKKMFFVSILITIINVGNLFCQKYTTQYYLILNDKGYVDITINGNILLKKFYGPPNYGESPEIDIIENYYVLILNETITFSDGSETETVDEIQLILNNNINKNFDESLNYVIKGQAFFAITGHHHTPIVISVEKYY